MSIGAEPLTGEAIRAKIAAMADAMMRQDDAAVATHFAEDAVMIAPAGRFTGRAAIYEAGRAFNQDFTNIRIVIRQVLVEGSRGVVEWSFAETRRSDGYTHVMEDAIVFELRGDEVVYWREYFDPQQEREL
jgi:uncharacterized protein (TIGR02246 family)